jgi:hypothetical protein
MEALTACPDFRFSLEIALSEQQGCCFEKIADERISCHNFYLLVAITLIDADFGEQTAQACANA